MVSIPEWFVVGFLGVLVMVVGWGAARMVSAYDRLCASVVAIEKQMVLMNGRIAKGERWQEERS